MNSQEIRVKIVHTPIVMSSPRSDIRNPDSDHEQSSSRSSSFASKSKKLSWALRMVQFVRGFRHRFKPKWEINRSPVLERKSSSPSCPTLTVIASDDCIPNGVNVDRSQSTWSLHVDDAKNRKFSTGAHESRLLSPKHKYHLGRRKLTPDPAMMAASLPTQLTEYVVNVKTSDRFGAGTDANVFLQFYGDQGESEIFALTHSNNVNKFERNQLDRFILHSSKSMGNIQRIKIWHDNAGVGAAWHLAYVEISDTTLGQLFRFPCHAWLSDAADTHGISRELRCFEVLEGPKKAIQTASGVLKKNRAESLSSLNLKSTRYDSLPTSPLAVRKKPQKLAMPAEKFENEIHIDSVFTPAPTRAHPLIRFPLFDDSDDTETDGPVYRQAVTVPLFPSETLVAARKKASLDEKSPIYGMHTSPRKSTVYGPISTPSFARHGFRASLPMNARKASISSMSSTSSEQIDAQIYKQPVAAL